MIPTGADAPAGSKVVLVRATADEVPGASLRVAGLGVCERSVKQLRRTGFEVVVGATADFTAAAVVLPSGVDVRRVDGPAGFERLRADLGDVPTVAADVVRPSNRSLDGGIRVTDGASRRQAEDAVFAELLRGDLGFVARNLNKPISFRITRHLLCRLPVTPNQVTLGAAAVGLLGCGLIATGRRGLMVLGFVLAHLQSVLDGCDGELARVRFQQSAIGEWLDTIVDDGMNLALIAAAGVGLMRARGEPACLVWALVSCAMLLFYNLVAYRELVRQGEGGEVLKIRWWFTRGREWKAVHAGRTPGLLGAFLNIGRRDFFVLAWLVFALFGLGSLIVAYGFGVALFSFVAAVGQMASALARPGAPP